MRVGRFAIIYIRFWNTFLCAYLLSIHVDPLYFRLSCYAHLLVWRSLAGYHARLSLARHSHRGSDIATWNVLGTRY